MVGQHAQRRAFHILRACFAGGGLDQRLQQIDIVVAVNVLQHRGNPLQTHAGVNRGFGQQVHHTRLIAIELHEHVVPDLDVAIAILIRRAGKSAWNMLSMVIEDLRARTAGACIAHHPEVV